MVGVRDDQEERWSDSDADARVDAVLKAGLYVGATRRKKRGIAVSEDGITAIWLKTLHLAGERGIIPV